MGFPITSRIKLRFRHSDVGLTPTFTRYNRFDTGAAIIPQPAIVEIGNGDYYFEQVWVTALDPDIDFEVDGGPAIVTEEVRYVSGLLSVRDYFVATGGGSGGGSAAWTVGAFLLGLLPRLL